MSSLAFQDTAKRIRSYILDNYLYMRPDATVGDDDSLLAKGIIDSMAVMELVTLLEDDFGVAVIDTDITEQNFGSVGAIARFVVAKRSEAEPAPQHG